MNVDHWHVLQYFSSNDAAECNNNTEQSIRIQFQHVVDVVRDRNAQFKRCGFYGVSRGF